MAAINRSLRLPDYINGIISEIARQEHRSVNAQIIELLETAISIPKYRPVWDWYVCEMGDNQIDGAPYPFDNFARLGVMRNERNADG